MSEPYEGVEGDVENSVPSASVPPSDDANCSSMTEPVASAENANNKNIKDNNNSSPQNSFQDVEDKEMYSGQPETECESQIVGKNYDTEPDTHMVVEQQKTNIQSSLEKSDSKPLSAEELDIVGGVSSNVEVNSPSRETLEAANEAEKQATPSSAPQPPNGEPQRQATPDNAPQPPNGEPQRQATPDNAPQSSNGEPQRQAIPDNAPQSPNGEPQRQTTPDSAPQSSNEKLQRQATPTTTPHPPSEEPQSQVTPSNAPQSPNEEPQRQDTPSNAPQPPNEEPQRPATSTTTPHPPNEEPQSQVTTSSAPRPPSEEPQSQATPSTAPQPPNTESEVPDQESDGTHSEVGSSIADDGVSMNRVSSQTSFDATQLQQQALEATIVRLRREVNESRARLTDHDASAKRTIMTMQNDMRARLENLGRLCEENRKEKEAMVLKYAQAEQKTMDIQRRVRDLEGRLREAQREKEGLTKQSRVLRQEKERVQGLYENKCTEMANMEKELLVAKDASNTVDMKVKWHQNKLKEEQERHKETQKTLSNLKEETETIRANCQQIIKKYQEAEEARTSSLKQAQAENHVQQEVHQKAVKELETVRKTARESTGELRTLRDKVKCLEAERMCVEEAATQAKERALRMKTQRDGLAERVRALESSAADAAEKAVQLETMTTELSAARQARIEMEADTERARGRETELLEFTQRLSDRNAALQAENLTQKTSLDEALTDVRSLSEDLQAARSLAQEQEQRLTELEAARAHEAEEMGRAIADKTATCEQLTVMLADERNEIRTLKKKHAANTKDLTRQLAALRKKMDSSPIGLPLPAPSENTLAPHANGEPHASPSSSTSSLDINAANTATAISVDGPAFPSGDPEIKMIMPDRQALIDKIVRLQRTNARHNEKIDFLAEHVNQLTDQLKRKNRLLQHFILREEAGSVTPEDFDLNKAALARKGGIMASVYSSHAADQGMTLDLSLEITRKLQAVLEDTLLKNITLKDNLNTLGEEISRLSRENREMQLGSQG